MKWEQFLFSFISTLSFSLLIFVCRFQFPCSMILFFGFELSITVIKDGVVLCHLNDFDLRRTVFHLLAWWLDVLRECIKVITGREVICYNVELRLFAVGGRKEISHQVARRKSI